MGVFIHIRLRGVRLPVIIGCALAAGLLPASALAGNGSYRVTDAGTTLRGQIAAANATSSSKQLWTSSTLDRIADDITGATDMSVLVEDDVVEWATFFPPEVNSAYVLGFVSLGSPVLYHKILVAPFAYSAFGSWLSTGTPVGNEFAFSAAVMTLIHESFHWRLMSGDESTVNACALKFFPTYLETEFLVAPTVSEETTQDVPVTTTTKVPVTKVQVKKYRVKVHGKWVTKTKWTKITTYVTKTETIYVSQPVTTTVPNPLFQTLVADAADFYAHQPPPYNAGTCSI